jgi:diguanylate cyclase (GGDEF)-like protein
VTDDRDAGPAAPAELTRLLAANVATGAVALVASSTLVAGAPSLVAVALVAVALALGDLPVVHVRRGDQNHTFTWSEAAVVTGLALLPAWWLPIVGVGVVALTHLALRRAPLKVTFNAFAFATAAFLATATHQLVQNDVADAPSWAALGCASIVYFAWNTALVSLAIARSQHVPLSVAVRGTALLAALFAVANTCVAVLIATAATTEPFVLLAVPPMLVQMAFAYRNTREVIGERDLWVRIQGVSEELQQARPGSLAGVALRAVASLVDTTAVELLVVDAGRAERHTLAGDDDTVDVEVADALTDDLWGRVACDRAPFLLDATTASPRQRQRLAADGLDAAFVVPLEWSGTLFGALRVGFGRRNGLSPQVESALSTVGTQVASAMATQRQTEQLRHQADHDQLTGLPNRKRLVEVLSRALHGSRRTERGTAVLFLDLDGFKVVNDSLGHHIGDDILIEAAQRIRDAIRASDVVARFGGDEFVIVCRDVDADDAQAIGQRVLATLAEAAAIEEHRVPLSASMGIAFTADGSADPESMLRDADAAMYEAKRVGPGAAVVFTSSLRDQALDRLHLEADLRAALDRDQIDVWFQPIVDVTSGRIVELEALARWNHPVRGPVSPEAFITIAEESGQIRRLGEVVLRQACADMRRWLDLGLADDGLRIAVNLSARQLDRSLPGVVGEALARNGLPPTSLTLEVTESALVDDPDAVSSLERLRDIGVTVSLDDFGTGYSSLSALRDLPVDTVKVDRSFVDRMGADDQLTAMVRGIIDLAHALRIAVVAEGVEKQLQASLLRDFGCDRAQGFLFGQPLTAPIVEALLAGGGTAVPPGPDDTVDTSVPSSAPELRLA